MTMYQTVTAEWNCTKCSVTNRKLVPRGTSEVKDRCVHCRTKHLVSPGERPVRWRARAA
ncbi:MAG TPA: hypothetical protein VMK53_06050 [Gemmatimonadales bacterium]|nr:hypothetical protein [Gemmatimonadales bacterium]